MILNGIWMLVLGILGAASLIIAKKPEAKRYIDKLAPIQGWLGAISAIWGIWTIITVFLNLGWLSHFPVYGFTFLAVGVVLVSLGLLLGVGVLKTFIKNPQATAKMDQTITLIAPYQGIFGLIGIGLGVWGIITNFLWSIG